jgi:hypothetical protein
VKIKKVYYKCDYCDETSDKPNFKYDDNSGVLNHTFDMCSDECREKHITFLEKVIPSKEDLKRHIENWV